MPGLPPARTPFPVLPAYRIRPDMAPLGRTLFGEVQRDHFLFDARYAEYMGAKLDLLRRHPELCRCLAPACGEDRAQVQGVLWRVFELLAAEHPALARMTPEGVRLELLGLELRRPDAAPRLLPGAPLSDLGARVAAHLMRQAGTARLADALALAVQEDLVLMHGGPTHGGPTHGGPTHGNGAHDRAELLHVCFPSHWNPRTRAGQSFAAIHRPVAHGEVLERAAPNLMRALVTKGPFVRFVWSLGADGGLNQNPDLPGRRAVPLPDDPAALARRLHFRVERQTTYGFPDVQRALFTIRVFSAPLPDMLHEPGRRELLARALRSMDEEILAYKNLTEIRAPLLAWLENAATL